MIKKTTKNLIRLAFGASVASLMLAATAQASGGPNFVGPETCLECHDKEGGAWKKTKHFMTGKKMHKSDNAKKYAKALGIKRVKKAPLCAECHYTLNDKGKAKSGPSCESCHGGAKNWVKVHNNYGGKGVTKDKETAAHKTKRIADAIAGGMIRPENVYDVAANCYSCHTVPEEDLVNKTGHQAGSSFELVEWSQGEIRHNFSSGGGNKPASKERKRVLYVAGQILDLEYSLRGLAEATAAGRFATAMTDRVKAALGKVAKIKGADAAIGEIHGWASKADLKPGNKAALEGLADKIKAKASRLLNGNDGSGLAAVDGMIPSKTKGKAVN